MDGSLYGSDTFGAVSVAMENDFYSFHNRGDDGDCGQRVPDDRFVLHGNTFIARSRVASFGGGNHGVCTRGVGFGMDFSHIGRTDRF